MIHNLRDLLGGALGSAGLQTTSDVWLLAECWSNALGAQIASKASPVRLVRGELVVAVAEAVWRQELALLAPEIALRLNHALGRDVVKRIRLIGGDATAPITAPDERPRRRLPRTTTAAPPSAPERRAQGPVPEPSGELGAALRSLAAKRAERIVADDAPPRGPHGPASGAASRRRW